MANQEHLDILRGGVIAWNDWRLSNPTARADLSGADLSNTVLTGANLLLANPLASRSAALGWALRKLISGRFGCSRI